MRPTGGLAALPPPPLLLLLLLLLSLTTTMAQLYGAVDLGLLPRSYQEAAPALARRQAGCNSGTHPCKPPSSPLVASGPLRTKYRVRPSPSPQATTSTRPPFAVPT